MMKYMHKETGSVDTRDGWIESVPVDELQELGLERFTATQVVDKYIKEGVLIEYVDPPIDHTTNSYGDITVDGKVYHLTGDAGMTSRLTDEPYHEAIEGEEYIFEMSAPANDNAGNDYVVFWMFRATKGEEKELDEYNYSVPSKIELI